LKLWLRAAVCRHFNLEWISVGGNGNCFFVSVITALKSSGVLDRSYDLTGHQLRLNMVQYFRLCPGSTQALCERVATDIEGEQTEPLLCSSHAKIDGEKLNGLVPGSTERYLDAVSNNGVWPQGCHWFRGVSYLFNVRVAVIIFGQPIVRYFGQGDVTLYLYKFDAETHYDPLVPLRAGTLSQSNAETASSHVIISSEEEDLSLSTAKAAVAPGECWPFTTKVYTSSYSRSAPHCQNAVQTTEQQRRRRSLSPHHKSCSSPW